MKAIVDTSVWSELLRRTSPVSTTASDLREMILRGEAQLIGTVRQEILCGIADRRQFEQLRTILRAFPDFPVLADDYELAAEFYNRCRSNGVQGSNTDFLICAVATRNDLQVFSTDQDFKLFARHLPLNLRSNSK